MFSLVFWLITTQTVDMPKNVMQRGESNYLASVTLQKSVTVLIPRFDRFWKDVIVCPVFKLFVQGVE